MNYCLAFGQENNFFQNHLTVDTIIRIESNEMIRKLRYEVSSYCDENNYYFGFNNQEIKTDNKIYIHRIDLQTFIADTLICCIDKKIVKSKEFDETLWQFVVYDNKVLIFTRSSLLVFLKGKHEYSLSKFISIEYSRNFDYLSENCIFFNDVNNPKSFFTVYNVNLWKYVFRNETPLSVPAFAHLGPNNLISSSSKLIAYSQATEYKIDIFGMCGEKVNRIEKLDTNWVNISQSYTDRLNKCEPGAEALSEVYLVEDKISRILGIKFISDSLLMVWYYHPVFGKKLFSEIFLNIDVWKLEKNGKFLLKFDALADGWENKSQLVLTKYNVPLLINYSQSGLFDCNSNKFVIVRYEADIDRIGYTKDEYEKYSTEYFKEQMPVLKLYIYSHDINH